MVKRLLLALLLLLAGIQLASAKGIFVYENGAWQPVIAPSTFEVGAYHPMKRAWVYESSAWQPVYSTITVSASTASGNLSGAPLSQNVATTSGPATTVGGFPIGTPTFGWSYSSGDAGISINSSSVQNPVWSETITAPSGGTTTNTAVWQVTTTDPATGVLASTFVTVSLSYTNNFVPFSNTFVSGSGSVSVPAGASNLTVKVVGGGGGGGTGHSGVDPGGGGGGGSGGLSPVTRSISSGDWGGSLSYSVGAGAAFGGVGNTSSSGGSVASGSVATSATGGLPGANGAGGGGAGGSGGIPGGATGNGGSTGSGGSGAAGPNGDGQGAGGNGQSSSGGGGTGGVNGEVIFQWS